ncbi:hypothetical protein GCG54_00010249 [Colletotrichum gloeosporioides]|uniref:Uncharacterized protein n=1 Tax=Colletotrichum gloeosporioides TaxID=474922 RepID=A0A8H4FGB0_COLGL|nr:uncharacterized protein GCG54_00010249 [Colletotrichum gloeosporioides]KAF3800975.1 hypothetical protein GCG54_00010249 [Colletotrichum gloeosporioides]
MQIKYIFVAAFASMALAVPSSNVNEGNILARQKGPVRPSGPSCCSYVGNCQASCCPTGCPK